MLALNLLPPQLKQERKVQRLYRLIKNTVLFLFILLTVNTSLILGGYILLQQQFINTVFTTSLVNRRFPTIGNNINAINKKIKFIAKIQKEFTQWSNLFVILGEKTPAEISIKQIQMVGTNESLKIQGNADQRDNFLQFIEALKQQPVFSGVTYPSSILQKKEKLDFTVDILLNLQKL